MHDFADTLIRLALVAALVALCLSVLAPFGHLMVTGLVLAVALYPTHQLIARSMGGRQGASATVMVLVALLLIGGPAIMLGIALATEAQGLYTALTAGTLSISPPPASVAEWPVVGRRVSAIWSAGADDLPGFIESNRTQLSEIARRVLGVAAGTASSVLMFLGSVIVAGILMAYGSGSGAVADRFASRIHSRSGGPRLVRLAISTVRSVAMGVLGVAFVQALLIGLGLAFAGVPGAGILTVVTLFIGIVQLPGMIVTLPVIAWVWSQGDASTAMNVGVTVYLLIAGFADNVLKPILLGRGVDAPMPVVLIGALGGMVVSGIIGLFTGAVVLTVGYVLLMEWIERGAEPEAGTPEGDEPEAAASPHA
jgi:predicted PurR-regulated permease PerM